MRRDDGDLAALQLPDIETFVDTKRDPAVLQHFNLSVQVGDAFMTAVAANRDWPLVFPGFADARTLMARDLWQRLVRAAYDTAEPGVLFDAINRDNTLADCETLTTTNPCGEIPLAPASIWTHWLIRHGLRCDFPIMSRSPAIHSPRRRCTPSVTRPTAPPSRWPKRKAHFPRSNARHFLPAALPAACRPIFATEGERRALGLKGCTVFRPNPIAGAILSQPPATEPVRCCSLERVADQRPGFFLSKKAHLCRETNT